MVAGTGSDMHSAITGAIGALRGPKHGGANEVAFEIQKRYASPDEAEADIRRRVEAKDVVIGFGHPVYTVSDPRNLGACLRSADAAGALAVIVPKDKSATLTPVVRKVACGAAEVIPLVAVTNLARTLEKLQQRGLWVVGTAGEAEVSIYDQDLTGPTILIMGAEGKGMRRLTREHCDYLVHLPMAGSVSSLNVSVATGVCLFEAQRQRGAKAKAKK